jgi:hypothetical protein
MRPMNLLKTSLAAVAFVLGAGVLARAYPIPNGTYSIDAPGTVGLVLGALIAVGSCRFLARRPAAKG